MGYTTGLTGETDPELGLAFDDEESVAIDPEWRQKMSDFYQDCFDLSQNFPQSAIGRQPFRRIFGRRKMSNLTCVLQKMTMLTEDMEVNMEFYTTGLTGETDPELGLAFDDEESVAIDPEWRQKMSDSYQDCFDLSQNFPQSTIGRQPFRRIFGRRMIFFRCAAKMEKQVC